MVVEPHLTVLGTHPDVAESHFRVTDTVPNKEGREGRKGHEGKEEDVNINGTWDDHWVTIVWLGKPWLGESQRVASKIDFILSISDIKLFRLILDHSDIGPTSISVIRLTEPISD